MARFLVRWQPDASHACVARTSRALPAGTPLSNAPPRACFSDVSRVGRWTPLNNALFGAARAPDPSATNAGEASSGIGTWPTSPLPSMYPLATWSSASARCVIRAFASF
ncbi:hypothetical protein A0H81_11216 [Grifola frondosa]|uniref:Uncharacterized protein n=1 Tax=Grifola frondosa TaxID=5627 RepID=A0A1C7LXS6_GRIFR|nr:hypothetical protein A0H81_11216 [Grifola frondosa]